MEQVMTQGTRNFNLLPMTDLTIDFTASVRVTGGTAVFRVRIGGTDNGVDGDIRASFSSSSIPYERRTANGVFANPGGLVLVKITADNPAAQTAQIKGSDVIFRPV